MSWIELAKEKNKTQLAAALWMAANVPIAGEVDDVTVDEGQLASCRVYFSTVYYVTYSEISIVFYMHSTRRISTGQLRES
jgi:hypothetical protein